jgi:hypothetical protein
MALTCIILNDSPGPIRPDPGDSAQSIGTRTVQVSQAFNVREQGRLLLVAGYRLLALPAAILSPSCFSAAPCTRSSDLWMTLSIGYGFALLFAQLACSVGRKVFRRSFMPVHAVGRLYAWVQHAFGFYHGVPPQASFLGFAFAYLSEPLCSR